MIDIDQNETEINQNVPLLRKVQNLSEKYRHRPVRCLVSLIFWCVKQLIWCVKQLICSLLQSLQSWWYRPMIPDGDPPRILFYLKGGVGDLVMHATYLKEFYKFIGVTLRFTVIADNCGKSAVGDIFNGCPWIEHALRDKREVDLSKFDVVIDIFRIPLLVQCVSKSKIARFPRLNNLLQEYKAFSKRYSISSNILASIMYALMNKHTSHSLADIAHTCGLSNETRPIMLLVDGAYTMHENLGLGNRTYITIQRGVNARVCRGEKNTKVWPKSYYNRLLRMIRRTKK